MIDILGLPLDLALDELHKKGLAPQVRMTQAPRFPILSGEARVLAYDAQRDTLLVARFPSPSGQEES